MEARQAGTSGSPGAGDGGRVRIDTPCDGVCRLQVTGVLDGATGTRVLRCVDARLALVEAGYHRSRHLLVDLGQADDASTAGVRALPHAHYAAGRRGISLHLLGAARVAATLPAPARAALRGLGAFPDLAAALAALHPHCWRCTST